MWVKKSERLPLPNKKVRVRYFRLGEFIRESDSHLITDDIFEIEVRMENGCVTEWFDEQEIKWA